MNAVTLARVDPSKNMSRFYKLDVQPTLFGEWAMIREWGRIGSSGTVRDKLFGTAREAEAARDRLCSSKLRRGYAVTLGSASAS